jgi:hypothetical protein
MKFLNWLKNNPIRSMFLIPIFLVAGISISHVVSWYDIANPFQWAIYLSIAIEIGAITALIAATNRIQGGVWFMFGLVTFIQMVGNIFYCFKEIDPNGDLFIAWVELTSPVWELMGTEETDIVGLKRWLAFLEGGLLPIISLTSLHFFVKYEKPDDVEEPIIEEVKEVPVIEEPIVEEETVIEEPIVEEEPIKEEPIKEEPVIEETVVEVVKEEPKDEDVLINALKKYKESKGEQIKKVTPNQVRQNIVNKPKNNNISRID